MLLPVTGPFPQIWHRLDMRASPFFSIMYWCKSYRTESFNTSIPKHTKSAEGKQENFYHSIWKKLDHWDKKM
jgi:hypothetical protein